MLFKFLNNGAWRTIGESIVYCQVRREIDRLGLSVLRQLNTR